MRSGRCLSVDTPAGIRSSFGRQLWTVRSSAMYKLLVDLRAFPGTYSCYAFGDAHHLTLKENGKEMDALKQFLRNKGYTDVVIEPVMPSVEDCFMAL